MDGSRAPSERVRGQARPGMTSTSLDAEDGAGDGAGARADGAAVVAGADDPLPVGRAANDLADVMAPHHNGAHLRRGRAAVVPPVPGHVKVRAAAALGAHPPAAPCPWARPDAAEARAASAQVHAAFEVARTAFGACNAAAARALGSCAAPFPGPIGVGIPLPARTGASLGPIRAGISPLDVAARIERRTSFCWREPGRHGACCCQRKEPHSHS
jgi:hypothetical protein